MSTRTLMLRATLFAGCAAFVFDPVSLIAQPVTGVYVGAGAMANFLQNETIRHLSIPGVGDTGQGSNPKFDAGYGGVASLGYGLGNGIRVELEGNYRSNDVRAVSLATPALRPSGHEEKYGAMVNVLYDFSFKDVGLSMLGADGINPYVGLGAGWAQNKWHGVNVPLGTGPGYSSVNVNTQSDQFAYQIILGAGVPIYSLLPGLSFTAEYRFYSTPLDRGYRSQIIAPGIPSQSKLTVGDNFNHSVLIGLRYAFETPSPPPPAPAPVETPVPAPARTYLVFFDWDRADLSDRARGVIADAAQNSRHVELTRIEVNGYTDTSGTPSYNQGLSVRRANAVAGELVRDGVPRDQIVARGFGDTNLLVATGPGVREPQNRRVEIILK